MKKILAAAVTAAILTAPGCLPFAVGYVGYKVSESRENVAKIQADVEREKIQLEREKAGLKGKE